MNHQPLPCHPLIAVFYDCNALLRSDILCGDVVAIVGNCTQTVCGNAYNTELDLSLASNCEQENVHQYTCTVIKKLFNHYLLFLSLTIGFNCD